MGWSIGYDDNWKRDIGYGVRATCDHPACNAKIDRGLSQRDANPDEVAKLRVIAPPD